MRLFKRKGRKGSPKKGASASSAEPQVPRSEPKETSLEMVQAPAKQPTPMRTSFFQSARNVGISGGQFNSTAGHHTNLTINFNQGGMEPVLEFQSEADGSTVVEEKPGDYLGLGLDFGLHKENLETETVTLQSPQPLPSIDALSLMQVPPKPAKPPTPPIQKSSDIYYRHLSVKELGYPLWIPEPNNRLPIKYQRRGIQIGDVGIITPSGSFDFLFNICSPPNDPINPRELPESFASVYPPLDPTDTRGHLEFKPNSYLASASIERSQRDSSDSNGDIGNFAFESSASEGAILTMPDGAYSEELGNVARFRKYLAANAEHWYRYVNGVRGREALNGDVRLVIGCHKTTTWGMATFSDLRERKEFRLRFRPTGDDSRVGRTYGWEYSGMAEVRAGPDPQEIEDLRMAEESEEGAIYRNQCLFIRTLNVTLRDDIWKKLLSELELGFDLDNSQPEDFDATNPQSPSSNNATGQAKGKGPNLQPHTANSLSMNAFKDDVHIPGVQRVLTQHPSKALNEMLLAEYPQAKMAITEDWDWMSVLREDDTTLLSPEVICTRIRLSHKISYDPISGVASLQAKHFVSKFLNDSVIMLTESPFGTGANSSPSNHTMSLSGTTLDGGMNQSPSNHSLTLSGSTLDSGDETDEQGQEALRLIGMNRSPPAFVRPLALSPSRKVEILPKIASRPKEKEIFSLPPPAVSSDTIPPKTKSGVVVTESLKPKPSHPPNRQVKDDTFVSERGSQPRRPQRKVLFRKSKLDKMGKPGSGVDGYMDVDKELSDIDRRMRMGIGILDDGVGVGGEGEFSSSRSRSPSRRWEDLEGLDEDEDAVGTLGVGRRAVAKIVSLIR